ncbi:MAG: DedA family protein [Dehalococcoidia bacterium]
MLDALAEWVVDIVESLGYVGVALLVTLENVFPPIPSEIVLALAGFVASRGEASVAGMIAAATVGSVTGAWVLYGCAALIGPVRLHALVRRYGRWVRISEDELSRAEAWFDRWSTLAVLLCRCVPLVRSLISIPAGFRRMHPGRFTLYTAIGSLVWNTLFITAGYLLGEQWERVVPFADYFQYLTLGAIGIVAVAFLVSRYRRRKQAA